MRISKKNIRTLALAMSIATIATSLPNNIVQAASETLDKAKVQSQELEMRMYFSKAPEIGDTKLHINTKKLMDDNKLAFGDRLLMKLIIGNEQLKKTLVNSVKNDDIKEDYTSVQIMGLVGSSIMLFREFTAGDRIELYIVKGNKETRVGNITVKGERSLEPIVEQTKDKIMMSSKMTGSIEMVVHTKSDGKWKKFIFDKKNTANAISYDFTMKKLQTEYGANIGDEFVVVHQEKGKGKSISKKMRLKDTYEAPDVKFKERKNANASAGFTISLPDNKNLEPTPIQNKFPQLKLVKGNEKKTYTINKSSLNQDLTLVDGGLFYSIPKSTPNNAEFKFSQVGENFNSSNLVTETYKVDMTKASPLYEELKTYPDEKKEKFKVQIETIKNNLEKEDRTQEEVDRAVNALENIILPNLRDKLVSKRQEARKIIEALKKLDEKTKQNYIGKVIGASTEEEINGFVQEARKKDSEKDELEKFRNQTLEEIKNLNNLSDEQRAKAEKEIKTAKEYSKIAEISKKYRNLDAENGIKNNLSKLKEETKDKINKLHALSENDRKAFIEEVEKAESGNFVKAIYQKALDKSIENEKAKILEDQRKDALDKIKNLTNLPKEKLAQAEEELKKASNKVEIDKIVSKYEEESKKISQEKMLEDAKNEYSKKVDDLIYLTNEDKSKFKKDIQDAKTMDAIKSAYKRGVEINLSKAKAAALEKVTNLKELSESELESAIEEIKAVRDISEITAIVERYTKINEERSRTKEDLEAAKKAAIVEVEKLSNLSQDEVKGYVERLNVAGSVNEINDIKKEAIHKNEDNLREKNKAETLKAAREELKTLVEEAKTKKLSPDSKLKEKFENTLKTAEAALNGQSLDEMNVAIGDLKRVLDEVKQEEKTTPPETDQKNPSPTPDPSIPAPHEPEIPKPHEPEVPKPHEPEVEKPWFKERDEFSRNIYRYYSTPQDSTPVRTVNAVKEDKRYQSQEYSDIANHWAKEAINFSLENGLFDDIVKGNRFEPNRPMTRAEFIAVLGRFEKVNKLTADKIFQDIDINAYYAKYVNWAKEIGLVYGMDAKNFAPNKEISREEMATILYRYKQMKKINFDGETKEFKDQDKIPQWANEAVRELSKSQIILGMDDGNFNGKKPLSRGEIAQIIFNINKIK